ncbi:alpha-hydroxy-acid oxidizing protein [Telmatospirillum siberiense]|uniref:Alpha-hydroxy-acid oxidizing enzyme n=1 Tax=Telmatospirillum siberiense TaxID=382514 RepID=A0A2N3PTX3_9PROT|nr:alpha-hydroxy-acid oxidizing protein [Telmatospirillum siberiense]PKU23854.1 alpha-hydroxy-acid oxidizing enzyme [Telmatospirillum siberiense]
MVASNDDKTAETLTGSADRREFLCGSALFGAGIVASQLVSSAHAEDAQPKSVELPSDEKSPAPAASAAAPTTQFGPAGVKGAVGQVYQKAREVLYPRCRVCPQCDGVACAGEYPGFGGLGSGISFQNNFKDLQHVRLKMRALNGVLNVEKRPDTSTVLLGQKLSFPAMAAPIGGVAANFGGKISDVDYFEAIIGGCADAGTLGSVGDSPADPEEVLKARFDVIGHNGGRAIAGIKPRPQTNFIEMIRLAESVNAALITIDIDSAGRYGNQPNKRTQVGPKTVAELRQLVHATKIPFLVKGIMTPEDALAAVEAGAAGIVVSNHGGRVLDHTPGTADVLPAIAAKVNGKVPILVDGCVHYGVDVLKYMALGASGVLVGRHLVRAAFGGGRQGVALFMDTMRSEFEAAMVMVGAANVRSINRTVLA